MSWMKYAVIVTKKAIDEGQFEDNPEATTAAIALINSLGGHPSYYNTQFALAAFFLAPSEISLFAWRMVANGLGGYWQFDTHNGGEFSVRDALLHLEILTIEESTNVLQFVEHETHSGCHYFKMKNELLMRIVKKFNLPIENVALGGKSEFSVSEHRQRAWLKDSCFAGASSHSHQYEEGLRSM